MSLYRLIYVEACEVCGLAQACICAHALHQHHLRRKGPTRRTIAHGSDGPCPRKNGEEFCRCPEVEGEIHEVWVRAKDMLEAMEKGQALYPRVMPIRVERGLKEKTYNAWRKLLI